MFAIIGILVVFGAVVGGYLMEHGNIRALLQPAELLIIGGAAVGTVLVANPLHILKNIAGGIGGMFGGSKHSKQRYLDALKMLYDLLKKAGKDGLGQPVSALSTMADSLPGLGIVVAVLGVVITMGALGGPPEEIGHKAAAALVGTFLGILLCYGLVGPLAANMAKTADEEHAYYHVPRVLILAFLKGIAPIMAVEIRRRAIPGHLRPSF